MQAIKKSKTEGILEMENLVKRTGTINSSITSTIQETEERISGIEDEINETGTSVKDNVKSKKFLAQNIQEIWNTMKRQNVRIIGIEEGEESQLQGPANSFNKIIEGKNIPNLTK